MRLLATLAITAMSAVAQSQLETMMSPGVINIGSKVKSQKVLHNLNKVAEELRIWGTPSPLRGMMLNVELVLDFVEAENEFGDVTCEVMVRVHGPHGGVISIKGDKPLGRSPRLTLKPTHYLSLG